MMQHYFDLFNRDPFKKLDNIFDAKLHTTDGVTFQVHRYQLSRENSYFKALYCGDFPNSTDVVIDFDGETLGQVLYYLYTNKSALTRENVMDVWIASDYFLVDSLKQLCRDFVIQELDESNCLEVFLTVWNIEGLGIIDEFYRYLVVHFHSVMSLCLSEGYQRTNLDILKALPFEAVKKILECTSLNVIDEGMAWQVIVTWFGSGYQNKSQYIPELLKCMYKEDINEALQTEIQHHTLIKDHFLERKVSRNHLLEYCADGSRSPKSLYFVVHYNDNFCLDLYLTFDDGLDIWTKIETVMHDDFWPAFIFQIDYNIFMFQAGNRSLALNLLDCSASPIPHPFRRYSPYKVVSVLGEIYALLRSRRYDDLGDSDSFKKLVSASNEWNIVTHAHAMFLEDAVAINDCIYAIGSIGRQNEVGEMRMQVYNPVSDEWYFVAAPGSVRYISTSVAYKGKLYIIGGGEQFQLVVRTAEVYDPEEDLWRRLPDLPVEYSLPQAIHHQGLLIVYEHDYDFREETSYPVILDTENEIWVEIKRSSPLSTVHHNFCHITQPDIVKGIVKNKRFSEVEWITSNLV